MDNWPNIPIYIIRQKKNCNASCKCAIKKLHFPNPFNQATSRRVESGESGKIATGHDKQKNVCDIFRMMGKVPNGRILRDDLMHAEWIGSIYREDTRENSTLKLYIIFVSAISLLCLFVLSQRILSFERFIIRLKIM